MSAPVLSVRAVEKSFGNFQALTPTHLDIRQGEFFSLLGPSGCGKTTLLRIVAGLETPSRGSVLLEGNDVTRLPPNRRAVNMVFQNYALFPHLDVRANIGFGLEKKGWDRATIKARIDRIVERVRLTGLEARKAHELSGGQRQRVALARALVREPTLLLLDEPFSALDQNLRHTMHREVRDLQREFGITFILVTHDQEEAFVLSDRIAVMQDGKVADVGDPRRLYRAPSTRFVAEFVGQANLLPCEVVETGADWTAVRLNGQTYGIASRFNVVVGDTAILMVRPEAVSIVRPSARLPEPKLTGTIVASQFQGDRERFDVRINEQITVTADRTPSGNEEPVSIGDHVEIKWAPHETWLVRA